MRKFRYGWVAIAIFALAGSGHAQMGWRYQMSQQRFNQAMQQAVEFQRQQQQQLQRLQQQLAQQAQIQQAAAEKEVNDLHVITRTEFDQLLSKANDGASLAQVEHELLKYIVFVAYRFYSVTQSQEKTKEKVWPMMGFVPEIEKKVKALGSGEYESYKRTRQAQNEQLAQQTQMNQMIMQNLMNNMAQSNLQFSQSMQAMQNANNTSVRSSSSSYKRVCSIHGQEYDIRYGSGCAWCRQPDFGGGKTTTMRCGVHGYWFDPAIGCPGCK